MELLPYKVATTEQSICTANIGKINYKALTKTVVTFKQIEVQSYNFHHCTHHEQGNRLLGNFSLYSSFFTAFKDEIHGEKLITYDRFDMT